MARISISPSRPSTTIVWFITTLPCKEKTTAGGKECQGKYSLLVRQMEFSGTRGMVNAGHRTGHPRETHGCPAEEQYVSVVLERFYFLRRNRSRIATPPRPSSDIVAGSGTQYVSTTT